MSTLQILRRADMKAMPWKNGLGVTAEVAIFPPKAKFADEDFLWRVSISDVRSDGPFSIFKNYDRILAVWQGEGLYLNGTLLQPMIPHQFSGDVLTSSRLASRSITDLGVIYRRGKVSAEMRPLFFPGDAGASSSSVPLDLSPLGHTHFVFCTKGELEVTNGVLQPGDAARLDGFELVQISCSHQESAALLISLTINVADAEPK